MKNRKCKSNFRAFHFAIANKQSYKIYQTNKAFSDENHHKKKDRPEKSGRFFINYTLLKISYPKKQEITNPVFVPERWYSSRFLTAHRIMNEAQQLK
jgi:hypothetical protein